MTGPRKTLRLLTAAACLLAAVNVRAQEEQLAALSWISGCWSAIGAEAGSGETWLPLAGGTLLGVGRTVKNGRTVDYEFMQIRADAQGKLVFIALPAGQRETAFALASLGDSEVVFENPRHDFPQRVIYRRLAADRMVGRIEGLRGGTLRGFDFPMQRDACEPANKPAPAR